MTDSDLLLEIGERAYDELSVLEVSSILAKARTSTEAGMFAFNLLRKKYKPTYRLGKLYSKESERFEQYNRLYNAYASSCNAGRLGLDPDSVTPVSVDRWKWTNT